ncbi:UDP-N-acetylglucosamine--N-acetylmuramyl-(pentapeptide) pyrophosphoryl-undecaprenol N-acetylglucosamine transferase [Candidatus Uhrbacteria bacterium]|nr:UDP-N-acetylglucosamine--N-acetylmuramyl-(pentapeptide) pyrophosphoryl-undecaprenol N-acetylglucosamine transferase [Candidatus Uhrbacteria bacterium]
MKILLAGGGTLGPVTPLLALVEAWRARDPQAQFVFAGTPTGPERSIVERQYHVAFRPIPAVRFERFFSLEWFALPVFVLIALIAAFKMIIQEKPDVIVGAGGYTQVPMIMVGWILHVPSFVFQTDVRPLLSTRLAAPFVHRIYLGWSQTTSFWLHKKMEVLGVPVRASLQTGSRERAIKRFGLDASKKTLLVIGGGTGSLWFNEQLVQIVPQLAQAFNVIHLTGRGKTPRSLEHPPGGYFCAEILDEGMEDAYAAADLVLARAGMGTISELSALGKCAILIPLPHSAQRENAQAMEQGRAARVLDQDQTDASMLLDEIRSLMEDPQKREVYQQRIRVVLRTDVTDTVINHILQK